MKTIVVLLSAVCLATGVASAQNLLYNGGFETPNSDGSGPDGWTAWNWANPGNSSWANWQNDGMSLSGYYVNAGNTGDWQGGGGGWFQTLSGTAGLDYTLSVDRATENWWNPYGEMRMYFLDGSGATVGSAVQYITGHDGWGDPGLPWATFTESAVAPAGTASVKIEFAAPGSGGTVLFDNALLTAVAIPEPGSFGLLACGLALLLGGRYRSCRNASTRA
jgi:hypothetical protein